MLIQSNNINITHNNHITSLGMIIAIPVSIYSSEYIFYNINSNNYNLSSRFPNQSQTFFPVIYSTEHIVITGIHIIIDTDIDIVRNLERIENEIIREFSHVSTECAHTIKCEWNEYTKNATYTDKILFTCKGLLLRDGIYCPQYTIKPVT